jgi:hypothetical protein
MARGKVPQLSSVVMNRSNLQSREAAILKVRHFFYFALHVTDLSELQIRKYSLRVNIRTHKTYTCKVNTFLACSSHHISFPLKKKTPWSESANELYRPSDRRLSAKWLPTFVDRGCHVVSVTDPYGRILGFLDRSRYFSIKKLLSCTHEAEWTPFQTHYFFSSSAGNRTRVSGSVAKYSDH